MLLGNQGTIANPGTNNVDRESLGQFGFTTGPEVVKRLGPRVKPSAANNPVEPGAEILVLGWVLADDMDRAFLGLVVGFVQVGGATPGRSEPSGRPCPRGAPSWGC